MKEFITKTQLKNLVKLRDFLASDKVSEDKFHMGSYMQNDDAHDYSREYDLEDRRKIHNCGTSACAVGYGPSAGIRVRGDYDWNHYSNRVFGYKIMENTWLYMFSDRWEHNFNTPKDAAKRISYVIKHGEPPAGWLYDNPFPMGEPA